jgi:hypothetical protein
MLPFIYLRLKRTDEANYVKPFLEYVSEHIGDDPSRYETPLQQLMQLRNATRDVTKDMAGIGVLWKYRVQLESLDLRLPNISIGFTWYDSFNGKASTEYCLNYEKACVFFNMGALFSQIAEKQDRESDDGLKRAFHGFQCAGSIFNHVYDKFSHAPTFDLRRDTLIYLKDFMLVQAQECFLAKGVNDQRKMSILTKIAAQIAYKYLQLYEQIKVKKLWSYDERMMYRERLDRSRVSDAILYPGIIELTQKEKLWSAEKDQIAEIDIMQFETNLLLLMQNKFLYFTTMMLYYAGMDAISKSDYGQAIARLEQAEIYAKEGQHFLEYDLERADPENRMYYIWQTIKNKMTGMISLIEDTLKGARKDNDFIYHQKIPSNEALGILDKIDMTQILNLTQIEEEIVSQQQTELSKRNTTTDLNDDLFKELLPFHIHEKASLYSEEKAKIVRALSETLEEATIAWNTTIDSMELKSVVYEMKRILAKSEKKAEGLLFMHLMSQDTSRKQGPPRSLLEWVERFAKEEQVYPTESILSDIRRDINMIEDYLHQSHYHLDLDRTECEKNRVRKLTSSQN